MLGWGAVAVVAVWSAHAGAQGRLTIETPALTAEFQDGVVVGLTNAAGRTLSAFEDPVDAFSCLHRVDADLPIGRSRAVVMDDLPGSKAWILSDFPDLPGTSLSAHVTADGDELVIRQDAQCPQKDLWGVEWSISGIPLEYGIIVPGHSGVRLTAGTPGTQFTYDYPMMWEAQLVIVEGDGEGFYVWARDPEMQFKRLIVERNRTHWRLRFISMAYAPFSENAEIASPEWRVGAYTGDWRNPARRYREWMVSAYGPTRVEDQQPPWIQDIRCLVIATLDLDVLEELERHIEPAHTILYVPTWRAQGYDRDYPDYDQVYDSLEPFVARAHVLGFKVMLHVNYFGVDPLNPLYEQFEPYHVRSPWGAHEKEWWLWTRAEPEIKFAYINPAHRAWRDLFVERMVRLCTDYAVDALHLDQTLCIFNDHNGLIDGMTMAEGNIALHRELREALPHVALSGEGLNEVTFRHEAFAQRHAWGIQHADGTWDRALLATAHPISSYLFRSYTIINGYLGCPSPASGQLYAAWNDAYEHWGVIPTLRPPPGRLDRPNGFVRQFLDEAAFWFEARPEIAMEDPWPETVAFPYRSATGERVVRTTDHRLIAGDRVISRTISGVTEAILPGTIPGWLAYDDTGIFGLDPEAWYPYFDDPRDMSAPHLAAIAEGFRPVGVVLDEHIGIVRTGQHGGVVADIPALLEDADRGTRHLDGSVHTFEGDATAPDGAFFRSHGAAIHAHPPWIGGTGETWARLEVDLPEDGELHFESSVGMAKGTEGQTDGVTFTVRATADGETLEEAIHTDADMPVALHLDVSAFAGRTVALELAVHPGPDNNPSFDWARWYNPRIVRRLHKIGTLRLGGETAYRLAAAGGEPFAVTPDKSGLSVDVPFPCAVYFTGTTPAAVEAPVDLARQPFDTIFVDSLGQRLESPPHGVARPEAGRVDGTVVEGLFVHPPNEGMTVVVYSMVLPSEACAFETAVGLREGAEKSNGVECAIELNGETLERRMVFYEDGLVAFEADLSRWAGERVILALITDSAGPYICDWVMWSAPRIREAP